jgi:hypothetical protein
MARRATIEIIPKYVYLCLKIRHDSTGKEKGKRFFPTGSVPGHRTRTLPVGMFSGSPLQQIRNRSVSDLAKYLQRGAQIRRGSVRWRGAIGTAVAINLFFHYYSRT